MSATPLSVREVVALVKKSKTQVHRDIKSGRLPILQKYPGYNGPILIDEQVAREVYEVAE